MAAGAIAFKMLGWFLIQMAGGASRRRTLILATGMAIHTLQDCVLAGQWEKGMQCAEAAGWKYDHGRVDQALGHRAQAAVQGKFKTRIGFLLRKTTLHQLEEIVRL